MTQKKHSDGIYALASGEGVAAISVVRLSGENVYSLLELLCGKNQRGVFHKFHPRQMVLRNIYHPYTGDLLDRALVVYFEKGASHTGEDMAELHIHGGVAVRRAVMEALDVVEGWRPAEPGEFTKRAFLSGKLSLNETEAVLDLVNAETEEQRKQAVFQMSEGRRHGYKEWTETLSMLLAHLEASFDFPDEELQDPFAAGAYKICQDTIDSMEQQLKLASSAERLHQGVLIVIAGETNVGKSTLINRLSGRDTAIVTPKHGTTRDPIELRMEWDGVPVTVTDTAGLRDDPDEIEKIGIDKAVLLLEQAHIVIWVKEANRRMAGKAWQRIVPKQTPMITLLNKIDLINSNETHNDARLTYRVSLKTGENWSYVHGEIGRVIKSLVVGGSQALIVRQRHKKHVHNAQDALKKAINLQDPALIAQELRTAVQQLGAITGAVTSEDILDIIFRDFCIGK